MTDTASAVPSEREQFERHVKAYTGRDIEYHQRSGTTGLEFGWACWQVARAHPTPLAADQEPFGYFRAGPFGWTDCAEADEGAVALYERPTQPAVVEPLTDEQIEQATGAKRGAPLFLVAVGFARAIEAAHGIGIGIKKENGNG